MSPSFEFQNLQFAGQFFKDLLDLEKTLPFQLFNPPTQSSQTETVAGRELPVLGNATIGEAMLYRIAIAPLLTGTTQDQTEAIGQYILALQLISATILLRSRHSATWSLTDTLALRGEELAELHNFFQLERNGGQVFVAEEAEEPEQTPEPVSKKKPPRNSRKPSGDSTEPTQETIDSDTPLLQTA